MKIIYYPTHAIYNAKTRGRKAPKGTVLKRMPGRLAKRRALTNCY